MLKRIITPVLFLLANTPDAEKNLEMLMSVLQATNDSVKNIRNGIDTFQASIIKMASSSPGPSPTAPPYGQPEPGTQAPAPEVKIEPSPDPAFAPGPAVPFEPVFTPEPALTTEAGDSTFPATPAEPSPVIQMPAANPIFAQTIFRR